MKKKYLLLSLAFLAGCNKSVDISSLKIVSPTGAPAIAFYNEATNKNFETNSVPSNIVAMMTASSDKDIVVIDTISGIKAINKGAPFKIAATITFGNFYIAATGNDTNTSLDAGDKIVIFGQNQTSDLLFHYIYGNQYDEGIEYVTNVQDAAKCLVSGKNIVTGSEISYVFIAEPVLYKTLNNKQAPTYGKSSIYANIQELYNHKSGGKSLIQASVFVNSNQDEKLISGFLKLLKESIVNGINNPDFIKGGMDKLPQEEATTVFGIDSSTIRFVMENNSIGLGYKTAIDNKENIDSFISLFGMEPTDEKIYF